MDFYWDRDLRRVIAPFANLYRHLSDWPYGWQTTLTVENGSAIDVDVDLANHLWYGTHAHAGGCEQNNEGTLRGTFRVRGHDASIVDPFRGAPAHAASGGVYRLGLNQSDDVAWEHDSSLTMKVCPDTAGLDCFEKLEQTFKIAVRVFPNETNKRLCVKPPEYIQQVFQRYLKREATEAEVNFFIPEMYKGRDIAAWIARSGSPYAMKSLRLGKRRPRDAISTLRGPLGFVRAASGRMLAQTASNAAFRFDPVALAGQPAPGTNGVFRDFVGRAEINDYGEISFIASITSGISASGVFFFSQSGVVPIALGGQNVANLKFITFYEASINNAGDIAFLAAVSTGFGSTNGIFLYSRGVITLVALTGQKLPDGSTLPSIYRHDLSNSGLIAFSAASRIYLFSNGSIMPLTPPAGSGGFDLPSMNDQQIAVVSQTAGFRGVLANTGVSIYSTTGSAKSIFDSGPSDTPDINDQGQVVFNACQSSCGIYRYDGGEDRVRLVIPADGRFLRTPQINNRGQIAFVEGTMFTNQGMLPTISVLSKDSFVRIGSEEVLVPGRDSSSLTPARFTGFSLPSLNNSGVLAFIASTTVQTDTGLTVSGKGVFIAQSIRGRRRP